MQELVSRSQAMDVDRDVAFTVLTPDKRSKSHSSVDKIQYYRASLRTLQGLIISRKVEHGQKWTRSNSNTGLRIK